MKLARLSDVLMSYTNEPFIDQQGNQMTALSVLLIAFSQPPAEKEDILSPEDNAMQYKLGLKIALANADTEFTSEESVLMKKKVCKLGYAPAVAGQICDILDGN